MSPSSASSSSTTASTLQETLTLIRDGLDKHYTDTGRYPDALPVSQTGFTFVAMLIAIAVIGAGLAAMGEI
jgi:type II secretory pathway pseudopilin PulG